MILSTVLPALVALAGMWFSLSTAALTFPTTGYTTIVQDGVDPGVEPCRDILSIGYQQDGTNSYFSIQMNCDTLGFNNQRFFVALDTDGDGTNDYLLWMDNPQVVQLFAWDGTQWVDTFSPTADFADPNLDPDDTVFLGVQSSELGLTGSSDGSISASSAKANVKMDSTCNDLGCQGGGDATGGGEIGVGLLDIAPDVVCFGESSTVNASATDTRAAFATFVWTDPSDTLRFTDALVPFAASQAASSHAPGDSEGFWKVSVYYFDGAGDPLPDAVDPEIDEIFLQVQGPTADAGLDASLCEGGSVTLGGVPTASGGTGPYSFAWTPAAGIDDPASPNPVASPAATTVYWVTVTDANGCSSGASVTVVVNSLPSADAGAGTTLCLGDAVVLGGAPTGSGGTGPYSYAWSPAADLDDPSLANPTATPGVSTLYALTVTDANSCSATAAAQVNVESCNPDLLRKEGVCTGMDPVADLEQPGFASGGFFPNETRDYTGETGNLVFYQITLDTDTLRVTIVGGKIVVTY